MLWHKKKTKKKKKKTQWHGLKIQPDILALSFYDIEHSLADVTILCEK